VAAALAPAATDVGRLAGALELPILAQYVDDVEPGQRTGSLPVAAVAAAGGRGSLVNHSEHPVAPATIEALVGRLRVAGLASVVCARTAADAAALAAYRPDYLAVEPPELIGGSRSVSTAKPEVVTATVEAVAAVAPEVIVLCGAGVHDRRDVAMALELGAAGVLVASAVARAADPGAALDELLAGF